MDYIKFYGYKNKFNCTIKQIKINYTQKTFEVGHFIWLSKNETITRKQFNQKIEELQNYNYREVKNG